MARKKTGNAPSETEPALLTNQQKVAALILAYSGYIKGKRVPRGAVTLAAEKAGVSRQSVYVWMEIPEFMEMVERMTSEGIYKAWDGLFRGAESGDAGAANSILNRLMKTEDPRVRLEHIRHKNRMQQLDKEHEHAKELLELKSRLGMPVTDGPVVYNVVFGEYGQPGFEDLQGADEVH